MKEAVCYLFDIFFNKSDESEYAIHLDHASNDMEF